MRRRRKVLKDTEYFGGQLIRCFEWLAKNEPDPAVCVDWRLAAVLTRRSRGVARRELVRDA